MDDHRARPKGRGRSVKLAWVQVNGEDVAVAAYEGVPRRERPTATCGGCGDPVTLKIGEQRAPHAAHRPEAVCALTAPESALHFNAKMHLAAELRRVQRLELSYVCPGLGTDADGYRRPCTQHSLALWKPRWDEVHVERLVDTRRPDLLLLEGGRRTGAIEVRVTHAVDAEKERALAASRLPWVELNGGDVWGPDGPSWLGDAPLPTRRGSEAALPPCESCAQKLATEQALREQAALKAREREAAQEDFRRAALRRAHAPPHEGLHLRRVRVFDRFLPAGDVVRDALLLADIRVADHVTDSVLVLASELQVLHSNQGAATPLDWEALRVEANDWLRDHAQTAVLDAPDHWFDPADALKRSDFVKAWGQDGLDHRWRGPKTPIGWRTGSGDDEGAGFADDLDLLRYFFSAYWAGLPCRQQWSKTRQQWFQTSALAELPWRTWVDGDRGEPARAGGRG